MKLATICYVDNGSQFLLLHRNKKPNDVHEGKWIGVGGKFEAHESPEECAIREIQEETGLIVHNADLKGMIVFPEFTPETDWYTFVFRVTDYEGEVGPCNEGTLAWVDYDQVLKMPTWEGDLIFMRWVLENKPFFTAKFNYLEGELQDYTVKFIEQ